MEKKIISTKADTLLAIKDLVKKSYIEDMVIVTAGEFMHKKMEIFHKVYEHFKGDKIVVRSSPINEDNVAAVDDLHLANVLGVDSGDSDQVCDAIMSIFKSYVKGELTDENIEEIKDEQVLIQRESKNIVLSGVVFTRDIINNRPYYMVNYDANRKTDFISTSRNERTLWIARNVSREFLDVKFLKLLMAIREIEDIFKQEEALDIGFGIDEENNIIIFRVRQLVKLIGKSKTMTDREFADTKAFAKCNYLDTGHILSDMAYCKVAELIGHNPRPLDYSIVKEYIVSKSWNRGLCDLGYSYVPESLIQKVGNKPYMSVSYAFEGLTPEDLNSQLKFKLYGYYEDKLKKNKTIHDKFESEIMFTSYDFSTDKRLIELRENDFSEGEIQQIRNCLYNLTKEAVFSYDEITNSDKQSLLLLIKTRRQISDSSPLEETNVMKLHKYVMEINDSIKKHAVQQLARQDRYSTMAQNFCDSLVAQGYFTEEEMKAFKASVPTVFTDFDRDFDSFIHGETSLEEFNENYGQLRMSTYNIRTDCYQNMSFEVIPNSPSRKDKKQIEPKLLDTKKLMQALRDAGITISPEKFMEFMVKAIKNREYFLFEYSKSISLMLDIIIQLGATIGIAREDMSYLEIQDLLSYHSRESYIQTTQTNRSIYHSNTYLVLPNVIFDVGDIDVIGKS